MRADAAVGEGVDPWDTGFVDLAGSQRVTWELRDHRGQKLILSGPTGVGCCGRGNVCRRAASPECGTPSSTRILVRRSGPRGSPKKNCAPCYPPCAPAAIPTSPAIACTDS